MRKLEIQKSKKCEEILNEIDKINEEYGLDVPISEWLLEIADCMSDNDTYDAIEDGIELALKAMKQNKQIFRIDFEDSYDNATYFFLMRSEKELIDLFTKKKQEVEKEAEQYKEEEEKQQQEYEKVELENAKQQKITLEKKIEELTKKVAKTKK